jgi:hypothetical protein
MYNYSCGVFWGAKFITLLHIKHIKCTEVKTMGETNKNIAPEAAGKTNAALKDEKVSNQDVKKEIPE